MYSPLRHRSTTESAYNINFLLREYEKAAKPDIMKSNKVSANINSDNKKCALRKNQSTVIKQSSRTTAKKYNSKASFDRKNETKNEPNKTKIIYGLQQDAATLINKLNKKRQKYRSLKALYATLKKESSSKIKTLEGSISTLIEESIKHRDRSHSQDKQTRARDQIIQQNSTLTKDVSYYKKELIHCKDNISELTAQVSQYKAQLLKENGHSKKDINLKLRKIMQRANNTPGCSAFLHEEPQTTDFLLDSLSNIVEHLITSKEYSEQKYNKLLALHEMVVDAEGTGMGASVYKVMDENEQLRKKLMSLQSTHKIEHKQENGEDELEFTAKVAQLEKELKSIEILNNKQK